MPRCVAAPRNFTIGRDVVPQKDLTRYVKWPRYIRIQRQRATLQERLKVPGQINQFSKTLDAHTAVEAFKFCHNYRPESKAEKKERLNAAAAAKAEGKEVETAKPFMLKYGVNHVTKLVESKRAKLVLIAHDVDPVEIVLHLPALCNKLNIPYAIIKGKSRLGQLVHQKTATAIAVTDVRPEDARAFESLVETIKSRVDYHAATSGWGEPVLGNKSQDAIDKLAKRQAREHRF